MRILLVTGRYPPSKCGVGDYTQKLAEALLNVSDTHVGVLTSQILDHKSEPEGLVEVFDIANKWDFSELLKLVVQIRSWKPSIIHMQYPSLGFIKPGMPSLLPFVCRLLGMTVVQTWHEPHLVDRRYRAKSFLHYLSMSLGANGLIFVRANYLDLLSGVYRGVIKKTPQVFIQNASPLPISTLDSLHRNLLRSKYLGSCRRLIVFFGFVYQNKGVDLIFKIANSKSDSVIIVGAMENNEYSRYLIDVALSNGWREDQIHFTGFISPQSAADLLAAADAVVLPFREGSGEWNTSVHSALAQGTFVVTTAISPRGDEADRNMYTAAPCDIVAMHNALNQHAGRRTSPILTEDQWKNIANAHVHFYQRLLGCSSGIEV